MFIKNIVARAEDYIKNETLITGNTEKNVLGTLKHMKSIFYIKEIRIYRKINYEPCYILTSNRKTGKKKDKNLKLFSIEIIDLC